MEMRKQTVIYGTPWRLDEEVGYSLKVVNGIRYANSSLGQSTVSGCYQVSTPNGELYLKAWTPAYYNPPLSYDRCAVPRPLGPQYGCAATCPCKTKGCDCGGRCGSGMRNVPCNSCGCGLKKKSYKNGLLGFLGESDAITGPDYKAADYLYQSGYFAPEVVNGRVVGQDSPKRIAVKLLREGDYDSVMKLLLARGKLKKVVSGPVAPKQPLSEVPIQMKPLINEPRAYIMLYQPQCESLGKLSASISDRFADMMDVLSESRQICQSKYQGYENPFGGVQGYSVGQASLKPKQLANLTDVIVLSAGINPKKAQIIRKMVADKLAASLKKRGVTVKGFSDGTLIVRGPSLVGQLKAVSPVSPTPKGYDDPKLKAVTASAAQAQKELEELATSLSKAVDETNAFMHDEILKEVKEFAKENSDVLKDELKNLDDSFDVTASLKNFSKDQLSEKKSDEDWSKLAGLALLALTGGSAKPAVEAIAETAKPGSPIKEVAKSMDSLISNVDKSQLGDKIASAISKGGPEVANSVNQIMKGLSDKAKKEGTDDATDILLSGKEGLVNMLSKSAGSDAGKAFDILGQFGIDAVKNKKLDFGNLLGSVAKVASDKGLGELENVLHKSGVADNLSKLVSGKLARSWWVSGCNSEVRSSLGRILRDISRRCLSVGG